MTTERFTATVRRIDDGENLGRIQVSCAEILGDGDTVIPFWINPCLDWGWFVVPDVGELIDISMVTERDDDDFKESSIYAPDFKWTGARYYTRGADKKGVKARGVNSEFKTNYGKRRGFATPYGHIILFDDTQGDSKVYISAVVKHPGKVESGEAVEDEFVNQVVLDKDGIHLSVRGDSSKHVAIVETLETLWDNMSTWLDGHTHPTGMGPSGPPMPNTSGHDPETTFSPLWNELINSTKVTIPDL